MVTSSCTATSTQHSGEEVGNRMIHTLLRDVSRILRSEEQSPFFRNFDGGPYVRKFEREFAHYVGTRHAVSVANGTLALNAAYTAIAAGRSWREPEAVSTPYTFVATISELVRAQIRPVFGDIDPETYALSPGSAAKKIGPRTRMVVVMHPLGVPADMDGFQRTVKEQNPSSLTICEDASQALGSVFRGKKCGQFGLVACFSLQQSKSLSAGEGGVIVTNSEEVCDRLRHIRNHGNKYGPFRRRFRNIIATNYRLTEIQAAIALHALKSYDRIVSAQRQRARILSEAMGTSRRFLAQRWPKNSEPNGYIVGSRVDGVHMTRERFLRKVKRFNRGFPGYVVGPGYSELVYQLPAFQYLRAKCPTAEAVLRHAVWIDARRMPIDVVKDLAREIERFKG